MIYPGKIVCVVFAIGILFSCTNSNSPGNVREQITGEWNNLSMRIDINSKNNTDSNEIFEVDRPHWEEKLKIKPIRSFFRADSTWNSAHYNLEDSLVYDPSGKWWIQNDQLTMLQLKPSVDTTVYIFNIKNDTASFECTLDWDMDGKKDDSILGSRSKSEDNNKAN